MNWTFVRGKKPSAIAAAIPTVIAFVVVMTVMVAIGVVLTSTGCIWAAIRRESRREETPSDWYALPGRRLDFNSGSGYSKRQSATPETQFAGVRQ